MYGADLNYCSKSDINSILCGIEHVFIVKDIILLGIHAYIRYASIC